MHASEFVQQQCLENKQLACQLLVQRLEEPRDQQQLERAAYLLVYALRLDSQQTLWQQTQLYPALLQLLRAGPHHHGRHVISVILEAVATIVKQDVYGCSTLQDLGIVTRLADALDGGVTSLATRHAIEALHALATHLPTSRDLILATGAVAKLVTLLRDSYAQAHYTMLKSIIWTLICLADDDPLCQAAARTAGAMKLLVSVMGLASFSPDIDAFMGLSALAVRALRLLGDSTSASTADQLCCQSPLAQSPVGAEPTHLLSAFGNEDQADWPLAAVPCLARMLDTGGKGCARQPLTRSLSSSSQKLRTMRNQLAHIMGAWVFAQALLDVYGYVENSATGSPDGEPLTTEHTGGNTKGNMAAGYPEDDMLVDTGFFAQSSFSKEAKAAAHEVLVRVLETGPGSLEPVKEAVGALRALATGRVQVMAAAADAGVVKMLVMLLQQDHSCRLAFEASELLTLLTGECEEQAGLAADTETFKCMLDLIKTLLQASDALSAADVHSRSITPTADLASVPPLMSKLSNLKVTPPSAGAMPASVALLDRPRVSWSAASVEAKPGLPAILTLPNGDCAEVSVPQSPLGVAESGLNHTLAFETSTDAGHVASRYPHGSAIDSKDPNAPNSPSRSVSNRFGNLLKRLGSINLRSSGSTGDADQPQSATETGLPLSARVSSGVSPASSVCTPFSVAFARSQSIKSDIFQPGTAVKPAHQPRHPSQAILRAVVTAMANLLSSNPAAQETLIESGAVAVIHDVLVLAGSAGLQGGLAKAGAHLVKALSSGNPAAQEAFGELASVPQLLSLLLETAATAAEPSDAGSTVIQLVWALYSTVDGHKANQLALQTADGLPVMVSFLAQASTDPSLQVLPPPPSHMSPDTTDSHAQPSHPGEHAQSDIAGGLSDTATYIQTADQSQLATALVWLIGSAAAGLPANQLALHQAGAVYWLLHQMQWSQCSAAVTGSMWALASLARDNADVQSEVQLQGGVQLLVSLLNSNAAHLEAALWALQSVISLHPSNQAATVQAGALPKLVGLLETGPDTAVAEYAADCLCFLAQGSLQNQDAVCSAGAMVPLLDIVAAGPDKLAAKSAALAMSAMAANHTANQDAFRQAEGLQPLVALLRGGCKSQAAIFGAGAIANLVSHNGINQDAAADSGAVEAVIELLSAALEAFPDGMQDATQAEYRAAIESTKALSAIVDGNLPNQDRAVQLGAPRLLCHMASSASCSHSAAGCQAELSWQVSKALCCLAEDHPAAQQACASAIQRVTAFLSHPGAAIRDQACQALACLTCDCHQNQSVAGQHGAVEALLQMLWTPCESLQQQQEVVQLLMAMLVVAVQPGTLTNRVAEHGGDARDTGASVQLSSQQKFALVCKFVPRHSEQHVTSALFAVLHQEVSFCKETACLLQKQTAEWHLHDWDLTAIKVSLQAAGITCSPDCLSCVGIPL